MVHHVFRIHGLPVDLVSDRGPQFSSRFWKAFFTLIGLSASLSSGFHTQFNGQSELANQDLETTLHRKIHHLGPAACVGRICPQHPSLLCHGPISL